jgi:hypothetical protein
MYLPFHQKKHERSDVSVCLLALLCTRARRAVALPRAAPRLRPALALLDALVRAWRA